METIKEARASIANFVRIVTKVFGTFEEYVESLNYVYGEGTKEEQLASGKLKLAKQYRKSESYPRKKKKEFRKAIRYRLEFFKKYYE